MADTFIKDPQAVLDYQWDWSGWLAQGETIADIVVTVPTGLTLDSSEHGDTTATGWISGGTDGSAYPVTCRVTTNQGRTDERSITILCRNR